MDLNSGNVSSITMTAQWQSNAPIDFSYTNSAQTFTTPTTGRYKIELWGAEGGSYGSYASGKGGYSSGTINLKQGTTLYIFVGQKGKRFSSSDYMGAYNGGGGITGTNGNVYPNCTSSGGGATDIRTITSAYSTDSTHRVYTTSNDSLRSRIMVAAGGGGGAGGCNAYGHGVGAGGLSGYNGTSTQSSSYISYGGNQTSAGSGFKLSTSHATNYVDAGFGYGGAAGYYPWGGGGSGWYGGGSGGGYDGGGAGGSSYISGHTGSVGVTSTSDSSPKSGCTTGTTSNACSLTPYINPATSASYTFTDTLMIDGSGYKWTNTKGSLQAMPNPSGGNYASGAGHSGDGYARITYLGN